MMSTYFDAGTVFTVTEVLPKGTPFSKVLDISFRYLKVTVIFFKRQLKNLGLSVNGLKKISIYLSNLI